MEEEEERGGGNGGDRTLPSMVRSMESLLMSRWMTPCEWRYARACRTASHTVAICSSLSLEGEHAASQ